jgi:hypothetical protein
MRDVLETNSRGVRTMKEVQEATFKIPKITERDGKANRKRCEKQLKYCKKQQAG